MEEEFDFSDVVENPPAEREFLSYLNPKNWGVSDFSEEKTFEEAFKKARNEKLEEFIYGDERYAVKVHPLFDASSAPNFNTAFRTARNKGEKQFKWNNKVFKTELVNKSVSDNYKASKEFINRYISERLLSMSPSDSLMKTINGQEFGNYRLQSDRENASKDLNKKIYTSITQSNPASSSSTQETHGYYIPSLNKLFSYEDPDDPKSLTTHIHELTHKAGLVANTPLPKETKAGEYLSDPYERAARHIATEYFLNKKGVKYEKFGEREYDLLASDKNLPDDVKQLIDLYGSKKEFIKQMNTPLGYKKQSGYPQLKLIGEELSSKANEIKAKYGIQ